jgi:Flp pilus assembly protein CpaB
MIDRIFAPFLTFALLIAGTATVLSASFADAPAPATAIAQRAAAPTVVVLETVVITGKRQPA